MELGRQCVGSTQPVRGRDFDSEVAGLGDFDGGVAGFGDSVSVQGGDGEEFSIHVGDREGGARGTTYVECVIPRERSWK